MMISVFDRIKKKKKKRKKKKKNIKEKNIKEKGENAGYQHFLLFQECFQKIAFFES